MFALKVSRRTVVVTTTLATIALVVFFARHAIVRGLLQTALSATTGYAVRFGDQHLGTHNAAFFDVHIVKNGDPVLDASRVDVEYALRDIFPGGAHRFGFAAISVQKPVLTITRHADGSLTFTRPGGSPAGAPSATQAAAAPYYFTARVRDGIIRLVDTAPLLPDLANQTIDDVSIDASVKSDARSTVRLGGVLLARRVAGAPVVRYPLTVRAIVDAAHGLSLARVRARELPLRGALGFFVHSKAVRFDDGVIDGVDFSTYAIAKPGTDFVYRMGGTAVLAGGRIMLPALAQPLRDLRGTLAFADGTLTTPDLRGSVAGAAVHGRGALFDLFGVPRFRLAVAGDGDLATMRGLFKFSSAFPLHGAAHLETLLAAQLGKPLIRTWFSLPSVGYAKFPLAEISGFADYYNASLVVRGIRGRFGAAGLLGGGRVDFKDAGSDIVFALNARGAGSALPYTDVFAPDASIDGTALFEEPPRSGFSVRGTVAARGTTSGGGTFAVDPHGNGTFGPFAFARADGSTLAGAFEQARPFSGGAGWLHLRGFRLAAVTQPAQLPGTQVPGLPPIAGIVDGDLAGAGTPSSFGLAGTLGGRDLRVSTYALGRGSVSLGGSFGDVRLRAIRVAGPLGRFAGEGAYGNGIFALEGQYDGTLAELRPFTSEPAAEGGVHGPIRATLAANRIVVQTTGAQLAAARVRGVAVDRLAGTIEVDGKALRVLAVQGSIGGARAVAADLGGPFLVSAPDLPVDALRGTGIPLQAGRLGLFGVGDLRAGGPRFDGVVALTDGVAEGDPVSGAADVSLAGTSATVRRGTGALGSTYGDFRGRLDGIGRRTSYDLAATVPVGDIEALRNALQLPLTTLYGSFAARLHVHGDGSPEVDGPVSVPEGSYNGLDFRDARAEVAITSRSITATAGALTVGGSHANIDASLGFARSPRTIAVDVRSTAANLADFDDYFDEAETLAGHGPFALSFANDGISTRTSGRFLVSDFRYRRFALGETDAAWTQRGGTIAGALAVHGSSGGLHASGTIVPASGAPLPAFRDATYRLALQAQGVDLATWLPSVGVYAPLLGMVDASATIAGRYPRLGLNADAALRGGSVYGYPVASAALHLHSDGARVALRDSVLDLGFARFDVNGSAGLTRLAPLALSIHTQTADIGATLAALFPKGPHYDVAGAVQMDARISGTPAQPRATVGFDIQQARYASLTVPRILGSATYDGATLEVNDAEATFARGNVFIAGSLPLRLQPLGVTRDAPLSFTLAFTALDLAPFAPFVPGPQTKLGGTVDGRLAIDGSLRAPRVVGNLALAGGSYVSGVERAPVTKANAKLTFNGTSVALDSLGADVGGGSLEGSGSLDLPFPGAHTSGYSIALGAKSARIDSPQFGRGTLDGAMKIARAGSESVLSGDLTLSNASIPFSAIYRSAGAPSAAGAAPFDLGFALTVRAGRNVRVQSSNVDIGASGTLDLSGSLLAPKLAGVLTATPGGVFSTYNRAFRVQQAAVRFDPANGVVPYVDMRAYAHVTNPDPDPARNAVGSADITVIVRGPADEIAQGTGITFSSNPPYSQEQIVGLLIDASLFGAVNFGTQQNGTTLRGAPGESNVLNPPGVTTFQAGTINFNQEAFSILNGQFTQRFLAPAERVFIGALDLSDLEVTVDYGGGVGYTMLKQLGKRDLYASFGQTLSYPERTNVGFTARPNATTSIDFSYFAQNGYAGLAQTASGLQRVRGLQPLTGNGGFTFSIVRKYP